MSQQFEVGQQFKVPSITWTVTAINGNTVSIRITHEDGRMPHNHKRSKEDLAWLIRRARDSGRLIEASNPDR